MVGLGEARGEAVSNGVRRREKQRKGGRKTPVGSGEKNRGAVVIGGVGVRWWYSSVAIGGEHRRRGREETE